METTAERINIAISENNRFAQYLKSLPEEAWHHPSACARWQVQDVVAHMTAVAQYLALVISRSLQGDASTPPQLPQPGSVTAVDNAEGTAGNVIALRERLSDQLLTTFLKATDDLNAVLAAITPEDWEKPCYHVVSILPVRAMVDCRLYDLGTHEWDIRSQLEPDAQISPSCLPSLLDFMPYMVKFGFWPNPTLRQLTRYRFAITDFTERDIDIYIEDNQVTMEVASVQKPDVTFHCDAETVVLLIFGRLGIDHAVNTDKLNITGDHDLVSAFITWFKGI